MAIHFLWTLLYFWVSFMKEENVCSSIWSCFEYLLQYIYPISWILLRINRIPNRAISYMTIHDSSYYRIWKQLSLRTQFHLHNPLTFPQWIFCAPMLGMFLDCLQWYLWCILILSKKLIVFLQLGLLLDTCDEYNKRCS